MSTKILKLHDVVAKTGLSRSTIYRWISEGRFPAPLKLGTGSDVRASGWIEEEIENFLEQRIQARRPEAA